MANAVETLLGSAGLEEYLQNFLDEGYDTPSVVKNLKDEAEVLEVADDCGITKRGHRRKLVQLWRNLNVSQSRPPSDILVTITSNSSRSPHASAPNSTGALEPPQSARSDYCEYDELPDEMLDPSQKNSSKKKKKNKSPTHKPVIEEVSDDRFSLRNTTSSKSDKPSKSEKSALAATSKSGSNKTSSTSSKSNKSGDKSNKSGDKSNKSGDKRVLSAGAASDVRAPTPVLSNTSNSVGSDAVVVSDSSVVVPDSTVTDTLSAAGSESASGSERSRKRSKSAQRVKKTHHLKVASKEQLLEDIATASSEDHLGSISHSPTRRRSSPDLAFRLLDIVDSQRHASSDSLGASLLNTGKNSTTAAANEDSKNASATSSAMGGHTSTRAWQLGVHYLDYSQPIDALLQELGASADLVGGGASKVRLRHVCTEFATVVAQNTGTSLSSSILDHPLCITDSRDSPSAAEPIGIASAHNQTYMLMSDHTVWCVAANRVPSACRGSVQTSKYLRELDAQQKGVCVRVKLLITALRAGYRWRIETNFTREL